MSREKNKSLARTRAVELLSRHEESNTSLRHDLRIYLQESQDDFAIKNHVQFLTLGVIRHKNTIDFLLARGDSTLSIKSLKVKDRNSLRLALFENRWLNEPIITLGKDYLKWRTKLRSVLETASEINLTELTESLPKESELSVLYSHPTFIIETLLEHMGEEQLIDLMKENQTPPVSYVRPNFLSGDGEEAISSLISEGITLTKDPDLKNLYLLTDELADLVQSKEFQIGSVLIHDKASIIAAMALEAEPGEIIWDSCAAPGMKTHLICENMENQGKLIASDINRNRFLRSSSRIHRWGCSCAEWVLTDAIEASVIKADKILIDAPCTSTGMLQSHPSYKWRLNKNWLFSLMSIQNKLLEGIIGAYSDRPGTEIVYSTCSILPHEGESQIDSIMKKFDIELVEIPFDGDKGYAEFECSDMVRRFFPHIHHTNGFFLAKFLIN